MRVHLIYFFLVVSVGVTTHLWSLPQAMEKVVESDVLRFAHCGISVCDLETGEMLCEHNADKMFTPASSTKIVTTAAALHYLGPDYRTKTSLYYSGNLHEGVLDGDLIIYGRGDGTLDESSYEKFAAHCKKAGIHTILGTLIIDSSYFDCDSLCNEWEIGDVFKNHFGVEITALSCNKNCFKEKALSHIASIFKKCLEQKGIVISKVSVQPYNKGQCIEFFSHESPPLSDVVKHTNKWSNNFFAELLINVIGTHFQEKKGTTFERGRDAITVFLRLIDPNVSFYLGDGSGLSRYTLFSPKMLMKILCFVAKQPYASVFFDSLPVGGIDGTLASRFCKSMGYQNVHAKTGTLSHVSSLSGYATILSGRKIAFSIIVNDCLGIDTSHMETAKACRDAIDALVLKYIEMF